jgi:hypothetical protein
MPEVRRGSRRQTAPRRGYTPLMAQAAAPAIERQARLGLLLALCAAACTSSNAGGAPSDSSADAAGGGPSDSSADAAGDGACTSKASILASSFDQSCVSDLDCVQVGQGSVCAECGFVCPSATINKGALAAYQAAVVDAGGTFAGPCFCPAYDIPCCHQGQCSLSCDDEITDIDACASAGGTCVPSADLLDGGLSCVRISYCAANPNMPGPTISVCCPAPIAEGGAD